jgi:hypothetical protein
MAINNMRYRRGACAIVFAIVSLELGEKFQTPKPNFQTIFKIENSKRIKKEEKAKKHAMRQ